jgi:aminoglycoside phosphotransferase (APT) family kinase protein
VPFYLMEALDGVVVTDTVPPALDSPAERTATGHAMVDTLAALHSVNVTHGDLAGFGRAEGYLQRQVDRFAGLWQVNTTRSLPEVAELATWLGAHLPESQAAAVVHGDYRLGNLMYAAKSPARVLAVLDWEMATLGDPLADLGYLTATYADRGKPSTPLELSPVTREAGYPTGEELAARYADHTGLDLTPLPWYQTLALWKAAIFCEAIYTRWLNGERPHDTEFGPSLEAGVPRLLQSAMEYAGLGDVSGR